MTKLPQTFAQFFVHFVKKQWLLFTFVQFFFFGWTWDSTLWPRVMQSVIDGLIQLDNTRENLWSDLATPLVFGLLLFLGVEIFYRLAGILLAFAIPRFEASIRLEMFECVEKHSYNYFSNHLSGNIANKITDIVSGSSAILKILVSLIFPALLAVLISLLFFAKIQPTFAAILGGWVIIHLSIAVAFSKKCDTLADVRAQSRSSLAGQIVDSLSNIQPVKLFARASYEKALLTKLQKEETQHYHTSLMQNEKMKLALGITSFLLPGVFLNWYMLKTWQEGAITTGEVVFIFNTTWNITMMVWLMGLQLPDLFKEIGTCNQALSLIRDPYDIQDEKNPLPFSVTKGEITFENVTFRYAKNNTLFHNKTLTIEAGKKTGLVGFSGSGKTTFVHLILRFYDPEKGRILIDKQDIKKISQETLREHITMIPQDPSLFHRSLFDNIRYGNLHASEEEVIEAAKKAHCHEFISQLPEKYATEVGERGAKLSGGQKQRIAIARAILKNAPILILDEATSALDSITERYIQESMHCLMENRTAIVIAHRLSTLREMDRILVFSQGRVVEEGTHEELLKKNGHYAKMWAMQACGFLPD
jgi:ATP-binding cassette, subfamily B, bacterial